MRSAEDIEAYMVRMGLKFDQVAEGTWLLSDEHEGIANIVVRHNPPVLVCRVKLMELPKGADLTGLFRLLLELNASEMISAAYGLEGNAVVVTDTLQVENLDFNEFQAAIEGLTMFIADHYPRLVPFLKLGAEKAEARL